MASIFDLQFQHDDVDSKIAAALERLSQTFRVLLWEKTKTHNLSPIQIQMVVYLFYHSREVITMGQLAARFSLTPATISDAVKTLAQKGLVERTPTARDRRAVSVTLTAAGQKVARKLTAWADVIRDILIRFDDRDKLVVMKFLMELIGTLQRAGLITVARMCVTCKFFLPSTEAGTDAPHYCKLMERPLAETSLRLDCPEHEVKV